MLQGEHSAILLTFIKLPFVTKIFVLSIFEWRFYTGFTVVTCTILLYMASYSDVCVFNVFGLVFIVYILDSVSVYLEMYAK